MAFFCVYFKELDCYPGFNRDSRIFLQEKAQEFNQKDRRKSDGQGREHSDKLPAELVHDQPY